MISIQGKKFGDVKLIKVKKRHAIQISLFIGKEKLLRKFNNVRYHREGNGVTENSFLVEKSNKKTLTPECNSASIFTSKCLSKTPTPTKLKTLKFSIKKYEFEPQKTVSIYKSYNFDENRETHHSRSVIHRKVAKSQEFTEKLLPREKKSNITKMTMRDLNVNLPSIIKSRKNRRIVIYRPTIFKSFS